MSEAIEFTRAEAEDIYRRIKQGEPSRVVAAWYTKSTRPVSHTTILKLVRDMRAEEEEIDHALVLPQADKPPASDQEQLAEALRELRRLRIQAAIRRTGNTDNLRIALRALALEISTLRFKMTHEARLAREEQKESPIEETPGATPPPQETPLAASQKTEPEPDYPPGTLVIKRSPNASNDLSNDLYKGIPGMDDIPDSRTPLGQHEVLRRLWAQSQVQQGSGKRQGQRKRSRARH